MRYKYALPAAILGLALALTGCGANTADQADTSSTSTRQKSFNQTDVDFAQQMIPHHRQAVMMADLAKTRAKSGEVKSLAADIAAAQGPEIQTLTDWLQDWNKDVPHKMSDMDHGSMSQMPGMMSAEQMRDLKQASGAEFDKAFLSMMIGHHQGAVKMARTEQQDGKHHAAVELAEMITKTQKKEIQTMKSLLDS